MECSEQTHVKIRKMTQSKADGKKKVTKQACFTLPVWKCVPGGIPKQHCSLLGIRKNKGPISTPNSFYR